MTGSRAELEAAVQRIRDAPIGDRFPSGFDQPAFVVGIALPYIFLGVLVLALFLASTRAIPVWAGLAIACAGLAASVGSLVVWAVFIRPVNLGFGVWPKWWPRGPT